MVGNEAHKEKKHAAVRRWKETAVTAQRSASR